jgi:Amt family ammonium transporter
MKRFMSLVAALAAALLPARALAQEAAPASETSVFLLNTLVLLLAGGAGLLAVAGLAMVEAGIVRARNAGAIAVKVAAAAAIASFMFWLVGAGLFNGVEKGGFLGSFALWSAKDVDPVGAGRASAAAFFFETALVAVAAAIISGALAERVRLFAFLLFTALYAGLVFPIGASWDWGGGYLEADWKFLDRAGATIVHASAGAAALAGALIVGARRGRFPARRASAPHGSSVPLSVVGALVVWLSSLGLIAGAAQGYGAIGDAIALSGVVVSANLAASGGVLAAILMSSMIYKRVDPALVVNGAIGGLVAISADPSSPALWQAALIGAFGGAIVTAGGPLLERLRIDDARGAVPAHLFCGVWGAAVVPWTNADASVLGQLVGAGMIAGFSFAMSALLWIAIKYSIGARLSAEDELDGADQAILGGRGYPEFAEP